MKRTSSTKQSFLPGFFIICFIAFIALALYARRSTREDQRVEPSITPFISPLIDTPSEAAVVTKIFDGDTIEINTGQKIRFIGVDAPEIHEKECYANESKNRISELLLGKTILLQKDTSDTDDYKRKLRYVYLQNGTLVNRLLIEEGLAEVLPIKPNLRYARELFEKETVAKEEKRGLWGACMTVPTPIQTTCLIKGNVNEYNQRLYHLPGCVDYHKTTINRSGEYWFCTEEEAVQNGFKKAKNCN